MVQGAHRPWKGEISVLVEVVDLKLTDILIVGIGAIWVEIVRNKDAEGSYTMLSKKGKGRRRAYQSILDGGLGSSIEYAIVGQ